MTLPPLPAAHVPRPRLLQLLPAAPGDVAAITAPAGWGKTTLLAEWARQWPGSIAWIALDARHRNGGLLLDALLRSLRAAGVAPPRAAGLVADTTRPVAERAALLAQRVRLRAGKPLALIVDDAHLTDAGDAGAVLAAFLKSLRGIACVIAARERPACLDAREFVYGRVRELGWRELALNGEEITQLFAGVRTADDATFLAQAGARTAGWAAGLRLLRLHADRGPAGTALPDALLAGDEALAAFFADEVLASLSDEERRLLHDASVLDRLTPAACAAVLRSTAAWPLLCRLERRGSFVMAEDAARAALRMHALLRETLLHRLCHDAPQHAVRLHGRAARWHARQARMEPAIDHGLAALSIAQRARQAGAASRVADHTAALLEDAAGSLLPRGARDWFLERVDRIPEATLAARPYLAQIEAWVRRREAGCQSTAHIAADAPRAQHARCLLAVREVLRGARERHPEALRAAALAARAALPADDMWLRNTVVSALQVAYRFGGDPAVASAAIEEMQTLVQRTDRPQEAAQARIMLGVLCMMQGRLHAAEEALQHGLSLALSKLGDNAGLTGMAVQFLGYLRYEWNRLDEAAACLERAIRIAEPLGHRGILTGAWRVLALVRARTGDHDGSRAAVASLARIMETPDAAPIDHEWMDGVRAATALARAEYDTLPAWLARRAYDAAALAALPSALLHARMQECCVVAEAVLVLGRPTESLALARALERAAAEGERLGFRVCTLVLQAAALETLRSFAEANAALQCALRLAAPEGMVRAIADGPPALRSVLARHCANGTDNAFLEAVHAAAGTSPLNGSALTVREREVLVLLERGLSNKAMASELQLSLATIKTHLNHLYDKLDARSRTHALARARAAGWLRTEPEAASSPAL